MDYLWYYLLLRIQAVENCSFLCKEDGLQYTWWMETFFARNDEYFVDKQ